MQNPFKMSLIDRLYDLRGKLLFNLRIWWFWKVTGWPRKCRCPQCAGCGFYATESMARYGEDEMECPMCHGEGKIKRLK
jgi:hypothetical protein